MAATEPKVSDVAKRNLEVAPKFLPTPEALSPYLNRNVEEVTQKLQTVEGREEIYQQLLVKAEELKKLDPSLDPQVLKDQLDLTGATLAEKQKFLQTANAPENKTMFQKAWGAIRSFPANHPFITTGLVLAAVAGSIAAGFYFAGEWELLMSYVGLDKVMAAAEAAKELAPVTPATPPLPGGGAYSIPTELPPL